MENVFTTFFDLSKKEQENSVNCVNCVKPLNYQTLPSKNETEERDGYYERTARPVGKSRITSTRPGLNQYKTPITKMLQRVAMIFAVLVMSVGEMWGATVLKTIDFSDAEWAGTTFSQGNDDNYDVKNGVTFCSKNASKHFSYSDGKLTFPDNNFAQNYHLGFPITGIANGAIIIRVWNGTEQMNFKYEVVDGGSSYDNSATSSGSSDGKQGKPAIAIVTGLENSSAYVYIGRFSSTSSFTKITKIEVLTPSLTNLSSSTFYQLYSASNTSATSLITNASFPSYVYWSNNSVDASSKLNSTSSISTPYDFTGLNTSDTYYCVNPNADKIVLSSISNLKSIRFYGSGNGGGRAITITVIHNKGTGSVFTISNVTLANANSKLSVSTEFTTGDLTQLSGYDADTYYTYIIEFASNNAYLAGIYLEAGSASGCLSYSFHYGNDGSGGWETECFVAQGEEHEMQIEDFTIPSTTHFYVGKNGSFSGTSGNASDANSVTSLWSAMYFATSIGDGTGTRPMLGQATGATGTIRIYDNSTWNNKQAAFIPDGYKLKVGSTEYAMAVHDGNEYRSDVVELSSSNARSNISVGITNGSGEYVATDNTQEMQHIFLNTGGDDLWSTASASNFGIYDVTNGNWTSLMVAVPGESYLYEGWVPSNCTTVSFHRLASSTPKWKTNDSDGTNTNVWNSTGDKSLETGKNVFTISGWDNDGGKSGGSWSAYEKKGKFRMNADWTDKNWYVRFVPYHVLHYDANGGSGEPADQSVAADASPCQLTVSSTEPTRTDYVFQGWNPTKATADAGTIDGAWDPDDTHTMTGDVTLYAVWEACTGPTISANGRTGIVDGAHEVGDELGTASVTATAGNGGALSYKWYYYDDSPGKPVDPNDYTAAPGTNNQATYQIPSSSTCTARHYFCVVSEEGCSTTVEGIATGALTLTEPADPCSEPAKLTNEIARFFVPCGTSTSVAFPTIEQDASTGDNTFIVSGYGTSSENLSKNATTGFVYGELTGSSSYIQLTLKSGKFRAGDVVTAYVNSNSNALQMNSGSSKAFGTQSASGYNSEYMCSITLAADNIESDGSIKVKRSSSIFVNRIIVTREPACFDFYSGTKYTSDGKKWDVAVNDQITTDSKLYSSGAVLTGGTITNTSSNSAKIGCNSDYGLVFDSNDKQLTITLSGTTLPAGAKIYISAYSVNSNSTAVGFTIGSNACTEGNYTTTAAAYQAFNRSYTVTASDGIVGTNTFTIKRSTSNKVYLKALYIIGCEEVSCADFTVTRGGQESGTYTVGSYDGSALTCTPSPAGTYTYAWKQYPTGGTPETAVAAEGTGNNTNSFTPNPAAANTYIYFCNVTDACSTTKRTTLTGAFAFTAPTTYTVTYNGSSAGGGTVPVDGNSYTSGSTVTVLGNTGSLTRTISGDAATFYGWNTNSNMYGGTHYNAGETFSITANTTLYAVWGYEITWNLNDGDWVDDTAPTYYIYGQGLTLPAAAKISKSGYTFDHWELDFDNSTITAIGSDAWGDVTLNAIWTADASSYSVTYNGNDNTSGSVPSDATSYSAGDIVTVKGNTGSLVKTGQTFLGWSTSATASSGTFYPAGYKFEMPASNVTLYAVWGSAAEEKYYYGSITITAGALTPGQTGGHKGFFTNNGGEIATSSAISLSSTPGEAGYYYESSTLTHTALNKSSNWNASSSSKRTIRAFKFKSGDSYTLALGSKVATSIMFYGKCGSKSKTMTVGDQEYESPSTADKFFSHEFTKSGNFTGNVSITQDGDFYGILVITISTGAASNFTVSFNMNGHGSAIDAIANVPSGSKIGKPIPDPAAVDWEFGGWYNEAGCTSAFDFATTTITADKPLYAKWTNCAPTVTTQPVTASYTQNATATALTVAANDNGGGELHYQWWVKENDLPEETGSAIPGETGTSFTPSTTLLGTTYYYCVVSNDCGNVFSNTAGITITDARPNPKANWDVDEPTHGGKGFNFSVEVNKNDDSNWDGTLDASMLTLSSEAVLGDVTVDNDTKTISGTYGVKGSATSPVTFYLLLPATATQAAARLDYDKTFSTCTGGGDGSTYRVPVRKDSEKDASNNYRWVTAGAGEISYTYGSTISSGKATSSYNSFDSIVSSDKQNLYVRTYNANIKKVTLYVLTGGKDITVESIYKQTSYKGADDKDKLSTAAYSVTYDDGSDENTGAKGNHYIVITLEDPLEANDILMFRFSKSNVKAYGAVFTQTADGGTETPTLGWSPSIDGNVEKNENAADFTYTATRSNDEAVASLGIISYGSSNTTVATVNATTGQVTIADNIDFGSANHIDVTITATLSASGCYQKATTTYTLRVKKYVCTEAAGTIAVTSESGCDKVLTISGYEEGASIQWYKDGEAIDGEIETNYTATSGGTYYAITHKGCDAVSNELTISTAAATATKIVDEWYVKNGRRTPDIALVQTENATSFTVKSGGSTIWNSDGTVTTGFGGCGFYLGTDGIIYLKGQQDDGSEPSGMTAEDETIKITASACVAASGLDIVIHKQEQRGDGKPEIAFVVDGTLRKDGGTATSVLSKKTSERPIWEYLSTYYHLTGCNAYWSVNSKELRQYYSQFDAILITDDPNTSTEGTGGVSYVKAFGTMVDVRPVLTMEAYVGKFNDGGWHVYNATPSSPNPRQVEMKLECKNHDIFAGLNPSTMDNVRTETINGDEYWFVTMVDTTQSPYHNTKDDYEALPALQGFDKTKFSNMLGVGTIKNDELQAGVERQEEPAARMMILGIQNNAMAALTDEGKMVVKNALDYLLKTDMEDVNDCANYFLGTTNNQWNVASNWSRGEVPDFETRARILRPVVVPNDFSARVARVDIASEGPSKKLSGAECTGSLAISPLGALVVSGKVSRVHAPYYGVNDLMPTRVSDVAILSGVGGNGTLIMDDASGENKAYVQMYSKAVKGSPTTWQYIGIPHSDVGNAMDNYYDSWLYSWSPSAGWEVVLRGAAVTPWTGYCITYPTFGHTYEMEGTLVATADVDIDVPASSYQIIGNSWVAPIQIANFEDEDFGDIPKTVYFFNTGSDTGGSGTVSENATGGTRWAAGTYVAVPIHMAEYTGEDKIIPSMQGFYVGNTGSAGTLHLDYDKLVRQRGVSNYIQGQMHAPRRIAKGSNDPVMLKMIVRGSRYDDRLIVAEREDFTKGHDDGWDGAKWDGSTISPTIWSQNDEGGVESVTATPDMEGTIIGFRAGEDNEYTFHFEYDDMAEPLFLLDMDERMYVRILTGTTYTFTCADKGEHNRFLLTRKAPGIATGCEPIDGGGGPKATKFIKDNKLYILLNGVLYDATGKVVE